MSQEHLPFIPRMYPLDSTPSRSPSVLGARSEREIANLQNIPSTPEANSLSQSASKKLWTKELGKSLCEAMIEVTQQGKRAGPGWKREAWPMIYARFKELSGCADMDLKNLQNKEKKMKKVYNIIERLKGHSSGWSITFDDHDELVIDCDDISWKEYTDQYPEAKILRSDRCTFYKQLQQVYSTSTAIGEHARRPHSIVEELPTPGRRRQRSPTSESEEDFLPDIPTILTQSGSSREAQEFHSTSALAQTSPTNTRPNSSLTPARGRGACQSRRTPRQNKSSDMTETLRSILMTLERLKDPLPEAMQRLESLAEQHGCSIEEKHTLFRFLQQENRAGAFIIVKHSEQWMYFRQEWLCSQPADYLAIFDDLLDH